MNYMGVIFSCNSFKVFKHVNLDNDEKCNLVFYYLHHCDGRVLCSVIYDNSLDWIYRSFWYMVYIYMDYNETKKTQAIIRRW